MTTNAEIVQEALEMGQELLAQEWTPAFAALLALIAEQTALEARVAEAEKSLVKEQLCFTEMRSSLEARLAEVLDRAGEARRALAAAGVRPDLVDDLAALAADEVEEQA